jgi:hypothetical protein
MLIFQFLIKIEKLKNYYYNIIYNNDFYMEDIVVSMDLKLKSEKNEMINVSELIMDKKILRFILNGSDIKQIIGKHISTIKNNELFSYTYAYNEKSDAIIEAKNIDVDSETRQMLYDSSFKNIDFINKLLKNDKYSNKITLNDQEYIQTCHNLEFEFRFKFGGRNYGEIFKKYIWNKILCKPNIEIKNILSNKKLYDNIITLYNIVYKYDAKYKFLSNKFTEIFTPIQQLCINDTFQTLKNDNIKIYSVASLTEIRDLTFLNVNLNVYSSTKYKSSNKNIDTCVRIVDNIAICHAFIKNNKRGCNLALFIKIKDENDIIYIDDVNNQNNNNRFMKVIHKNNNIQNVYIVIHCATNQNTQQINKTLLDLHSFIGKSNNVIIIGDGNGCLSTNKHNFNVKTINTFTGSGASKDHPYDIGIDVIATVSNKIKMDIFGSNKLEELKYNNKLMFDKNNDDDIIIKDICSMMHYDQFGYSDHMRLQIKDINNISYIVSSTMGPFVAFATFLFKITEDNIDNVLDILTKI